MDLSCQVQKAFSRLDKLSQYDDITFSHELKKRLLSELQYALHELQATANELQKNNEEMAASRQNLEKERLRYQELFDFAPDGYLVTDLEGIILDANVAAAKLFKSSKLKLNGKPLAMFFRGEEQSTLRTNLAELKRGTVGRIENWELLMECGKQNTLPICITVGKATTSRQREPELLWSLRDITKRKQLEEELQKSAKLESIGVLAGGIAHDLNNFLAVILGHLSLVKRRVREDPKAQHSFQCMEKAVHQTTNLTRQLLTFAGGGKPLTKPVSLSSLIEENSAFVLSGSNTKCEISYPEDLPAVEIDPGQITQVLTNLLINADQAMPEGGTIKIHAEKLEVTSNNSEILPLQSGNYVVLTITDEGPGIPRIDLPKIFDPYFSTKKYGNGLGLAICYSILRKHSGHISVQSKEGEGTSFTIYLPVSHASVEYDADPDFLALGEGKVLLMEDEEAVGQTAHEMLNFLGYEVELAKDGNEAIRLYKDAFFSDRPFDLVIADLTIRGGMGGKTALQELIKVNPNVKAIVSSGYSSDALANYKEYGFCDVIAKPYRLQELGQVSSRVMRESN